MKRPKDGGCVRQRIDSAAAMADEWSVNYRGNIMKKLVIALLAAAGLSGCVGYLPYDDGPGRGPGHAPLYRGDDGHFRGDRDRDRDRDHDRGRDGDRDGVPNRADRDRDGDGTRNRNDRRPDNPYRD